MSATAPVSLTHDLLRHLRAARLEARIYDANHPRRQTRAEELRELIIESVQSGRIEFGIEGDDLRVNDHRVNDEVTRELVDTLRERMIRSVSIGMAVRLEEIILLIDLLISPPTFPGSAEHRDFPAAHITIEFFDDLLDIDALGNRTDLGGIDVARWGDFAPEQVAAIRVVTADDKINSKIQRIQQFEGDNSVDFIKRFFRLLATDPGTNWHSPDELTGTLVAGLDLLHEAQQSRQETGEVPESLFTESEGVGSHLQARFRWKLLGSMFGADEASLRTAEQIPFPSDRPEIDLADLNSIEPGRFPSELGEIITGSLTPLVELEVYVQTLEALSEDIKVSTEAWDEIFAELIGRRHELEGVLRLFVTRLVEDADSIRFFQGTLLSPEVLRLLTSELTVELCVRGQVDELDELLDSDPEEVLDEESPYAKGPFAPILDIVRDGDVRSLDLAYLLILRGSPETRWQGEWGRWLIDHIREIRAVGSWLKSRAETVFSPEQHPFLFSLPDEVLAELRDSVDDLDAETLLRFLNAVEPKADDCPLSYLVSATRHPSPSVRSLAMKCLANRNDAASVGILFHRLQTCGNDGASDEELTYIFEGLERRDDVDVCPRLKEIATSRVGFRYVWPRKLRTRAKLALRRIRKARNPRGQ